MSEQEQPRRRPMAERRATMEAQIKNLQGSLKALAATNERLLRGADREQIAAWLEECLVASDEWDAMASGGDVMAPEAEVLFTAAKAAEIISRSLQPIGSFNGGGSICVFRDPKGWHWPELTTTPLAKSKEQNDLG